MMDGPFFGRYWSPTTRPSYSPGVTGFPVHHVTTSPSKAASKVVSIPVHFVGSERSRAASSTRIQKVFRGFLVRKSMKKILAVRREVDAIELRIPQSETVELIRNDPKERLKASEMLMALLLQLDSVRGVDCAVRECRKAVIKKAIRLQEMVDSIVDGEETPVRVETTVANGQSHGESAVDQNLESEDFVERSVDDARDQSMEAQEEVPNGKPLSNFVNDCNCSGSAAESHDSEAMLNLGESDLNCDGVEKSLNSHISAVSQSNLGETKVMPDGVGENQAVEIGHEKMNFVEGGVDSGVKSSEDTLELQEIVENDLANPSAKERVMERRGSTEHQSDSIENQSESLVNPQSLIERDGESIPESREDEMEIMHHNRTEGSSEVSLKVGGRDEDKNNRELLVRMMEDNERLMGLMTDLYERNAMQTRLLSSLSQRVELLERAFMCEKLRKKKKRQSRGWEMA